MKGILVIGVLIVGLFGSLSHAIEPANPDLIPEARAVLDYLASVEGNATLAGVSGRKNAEAIKEVSGKYPAVVALDLSGWNSPPWGDTYNPVVQNTVDRAKAWWQNGGIVAMQLHWIHPSNPNGSAWRGKHGRKEASGPFDFAAALKPGTETNSELMRDLKGHADFLQQLADARVPVLWRPLHEIDGGWFWWTDGEQPENTAALWRMMFDYFVKERKLNNLIWVYNAGLKPPKGRNMPPDDPMLEAVQYNGAQSIAVAPSDSNRVYLAWGTECYQPSIGALYASDDKGETWVRRSQKTDFVVKANGSIGRMEGERLAVDPVNADVAYFGSTTEGLWRTTDGGKSWHRIPTDQVPVGIPAQQLNKNQKTFPVGVAMVVFDPTGKVLDGRSQRIWCAVWGAGIYRSDDRGETWRKVHDRPDITELVVARDGTVYATAGNHKVGTTAYCKPDVMALRFRDGKWTDISPKGCNRKGNIAVSPTNPSFAFVFDGNGDPYRSRDGGKSWTVQVQTADLLATSVRQRSTDYQRAGHLLACWGMPGRGGGVIRSTNGGQTWQRIPALEQGWVCSLGKAKLDGGPSTLYVRGICAGQVGTWRSTDDGKTWQMIGDHPCGIYHQGEHMWADWEHFGVVYFALRGNGFAYGQPEIVKSTNQ